MRSTDLTYSHRQQYRSQKLQIGSMVNLNLFGGKNVERRQMKVITEVIFLQYDDEDFLLNIKNITIIDTYGLGCGCERRRGCGRVKPSPSRTHTIPHFYFRHFVFRHFYFRHYSDDLVLSMRSIPSFNHMVFFGREFYIIFL